MSPSSRRRSGSGIDALLIDTRRRKRRRQRSRHRRRRTTAVLLAFVALPIVLLTAASVGGTAAFGSSCNLNTLRPVAIGQNSFVYAADGSVLGAIPAERDASVYVSALDVNATLTIRAAAPTEDAAQKLERDLRARAHGRLRALGVWG